MKLLDFTVRISFKKYKCIYYRQQSFLACTMDLLIHLGYCLMHQVPGQPKQFLEYDALFAHHQFHENKPLVFHYLSLDLTIHHYNSDCVLRK